MKVLITGGAGSIGSHLTETLLWRGDEVVVLDDLSGSSKEGLRYVEGFTGLSFVQGSSLDEKLVERLVGSVDSIVHLAGAGASLDTRARLETNIQGAVNVLGAAAAHSRRTAMVPSQEWTSSTGSKAEEKLAVRVAQKWGLPFTITRIHNVISPREAEGNKTLLSHFVDAALDGRAIEVPGDGTDRLSFVYVDDVVAGILLAIDNTDSIGSVFTFGSGEVVTTLELACLVIEACESDAPITFGSAKDDLNTDKVIPDVTNAYSELGFESRWSISDGIAALVAAKLGRPIPHPLGDAERRELPSLIDLRDVAIPAVEETLASSPFRRRVKDQVSAGIAPSQRSPL